MKHIKAKPKRREKKNKLQRKKKIMFYQNSFSSISFGGIEWVCMEFYCECNVEWASVLLYDALFVSLFSLSS